MKNQIFKCDIQHSNSIWKIINSCSEWLSQQGMNHWKDYYTKDIILEKLQTSTLYGLFVKNNLIGTISLSTKTPEYYIKEDLNFYNDVRAEAVYISMLAISPEYHKQGLASKLVQFAEHFAKESNIKYIRLDAFTPYKELNNFYLKRGYKFLQSRIDEDEDDLSFYEKKI